MWLSDIQTKAADFCNLRPRNILWPLQPSPQDPFSAAGTEQATIVPRRRIGFIAALPCSFLLPNWSDPRICNYSVGSVSEVTFARPLWCVIFLLLFFCAFSLP